jgi:hypothetical protein
MPKDMLHLCDKGITKTKPSLEMAMLFYSTHSIQARHHCPS